MCRSSADGGRRCPGHTSESAQTAHNERRRRNRAVKADVLGWAKQHGHPPETLTLIRRLSPTLAVHWGRTHRAPAKVAPPLLDGQRLPLPVAAPKPTVAANEQQRCPHCGRWLGDAGHSCPEVVQTRPVVGQLAVWGPAGCRVRSVGPRRILAELDVGPVSVELSAAVDAETAQRDPQTAFFGHPGLVTGSVAVAGIDDENSDLHVDRRQLHCTCQEYRQQGTCGHVPAAVETLQAAIMTELHAVDAGLERRLVPGEPDDATDDETTQPPPEDLSTFSYLEDPQRFADDVRRAQARADAGEDPVPYLTEQAIYGYGAALTFGVELEFSTDDTVVHSAFTADELAEHPDAFVDQEPEYEWEPIPAAPDDGSGEPGTTQYRQVEVDVADSVTVDGLEAADFDDNAAVAFRVGVNLSDAGYIASMVQRDYHDAKTSGYDTDARSGWSFEKDGSCAGEVVSPILTDTPQAWASLRGVCEQIGNAGAAASEYTGSHVHVDAAALIDDPDRVSRLLEFTYAHQDDIYKMSDAGTGRPLQYTDPGVVPPKAGYPTVAAARDQHLKTWLSLTNLPDPTDPDRAPSATVEWRVFDGSLDPGRIQAQIKLAAAATDYATRHPHDPDDDPSPLGQAHDAGHTRTNPDNPDFETTSRRARTLIDTLFHRDTDKQQIAALWAVGNYRDAHHRYYL